MPTQTLKPSPTIRIDFLYDFEKKEFILRFENEDWAKHYREKNHEARIFHQHPRDVWLPHAVGMTGLRSSSGGMIVVFDTEEAATRWSKQTIIGDHNWYDGHKKVGVRFERDWQRVVLADRIGELKKSPSTSPGPPGPPGPVRPRSAQSAPPNPQSFGTTGMNISPSAPSNHTTPVYNPALNRGSQHS